MNDTKEALPTKIKFEVLMTVKNPELKASEKRTSEFIRDLLNKLSNNQLKDFSKYEPADNISETIIEEVNVTFLEIKE